MGYNPAAGFGGYCLCDSAYREIASLRETASVIVFGHARRADYPLQHRPNVVAEIVLRVSVLGPVAQHGTLLMLEHVLLQLRPGNKALWV